MLLPGNTGIHTEDQLLNEVKNGSKILVMNDRFEPHYQTDFKMINLIKSKLKKEGKVGIFDVYVK